MCRTRQHMHKGCRMHETTMKSHVVVRLQVRGKTGNRVALVRNTATICAHENPSLAVAWGAFESNLDPTTCSMRDQGGGVGFLLFLLGGMFNLVPSENRTTRQFGEGDASLFTTLLTGDKRAKKLEIVRGYPRYVHTMHAPRVHSAGSRTKTEANGLP